ncbi:hypothetical protein ACCH70_004597 [Vibrio vulnificus]|nr:hypothetical protein [Vibrio vulnificus]EHU4850830.1 hypothetical protein [Vibrio vulnificus]ELX4174674.1 hypothetical protein [Vibrio vulnificus]ELX4176323.1 hypothetical protein [Vibrio vulnificus]MCU8466384.1 hypothetical protein [Vibrio vulnificus]
MKLAILDRKTEGNATCYLCKVNMQEYLNSLSSDYKDWNIQRGIIDNRYLDDIIDTVLNKKHIPSLVLISENDEISETLYNEKATIKNFKILDGLQRTHRLKTILNSKEFILEHFEDIKKLTPIGISRKYLNEINSKNASTTIIKKLINEINSGKSLDSILDFDQWIEVWEGLSIKEQVDKMLILNAGHKHVSLKHQLEIIFFNTIDFIEKEVNDNFKIIRERDINSVNANKNRKPGEFNFSLIISALLSLNDGKAITINSSLISNIQKSEELSEFNYKTILLVCKFLLELDKQLFDTYGELGTKWLGRDVVISGLMGAIGNHAYKNNISISESFEIATQRLIEVPKSLDLNGFETERNNVNYSKVNIGEFNKKSVFNAITQMLCSDVRIIPWRDIFGG